MLENLGEYIKQAPLLAIMVAFAGGVLTSFTPCVYPVIPITIGVIGARGARSRLHALRISLIYVLGMAIIYALLGMMAALTGQFFGKVSVHPITNLVVGNICILFALNMFDVFTIPMPSFLTKASSAASKRKGVIGLLLMGATSGTIIAPCTAPVLGTVLTFVSTTQNVVYGFFLLFTFALGLGTLIVIVGVFSGLLSALPKSGVWMVAIKKTLGFLMIIAGEYFIMKAAGLW